MNNLLELHQEHVELTSEVNFLKKEIDFLLKMLRNAYCISSNIEKVKLLDGYWRGFEKNRDRLDELLNKIKKEELNLSRIFQSQLIDEEKTLFKEDSLIASFYKINKEVKTLKESFYDTFGCDVCCHKQN